MKRVLACLPGLKQTLLFSATMPREIEELADGLLHGPEKEMCIRDRSREAGSHTSRILARNSSKNGSLLVSNSTVFSVPFTI